MLSSPRTLVETAIFAALAMALSLIPDFASWFTPSFGAIPLMILALRRGLKYGLLAGLLWGLLHFLLGRVYYLSISQVLIEYVLAFTAMGLAGFVTEKFQENLAKNKLISSFFLASIGVSLAIFTRYLLHFIAGVIFWSEYAGKMSPYLYSFLVNGTAGGLTWAFSIIAILLILSTQPTFFRVKQG